MEDRLEVAADYFVVADVDMLERGLIEIATLLLVGLEIVLLCIGEELAAIVERLGDLVLADGCLKHLSLDLGTTGSDARLLTLEVIDRDGVGVVCLQELLTAPIEFVESATR